MRVLKPFMIGLCLVASLAASGCAEQSADGAEQPVANDQTGAPDHVGDGQTSSFSEPTSGQQENDSQEDQPAYVAMDPPSIDGESELSLGKNYRLRLLLDGRWREFWRELPAGDLTGREEYLRSHSDVSAKLTCGDSDCSESDVVLSYGGKKARVHLRRLKMQALRGEFQQNCEVPLFFDYEIDHLIGATSALRASIEQYQKINSVEATLVRTETWDQEEFESINVDLYSDTNEVMSLNDPRRSSSQTMNVRKSRIPPAKNFSYGLIGDAQSLTLDFIKFHFPTLGDSSGELCYHLPLIPQVLQN